MLKTENLLLTGGNVEISAAGKTPTVTILAYSGGLMNVPGWGQIVIDFAGLDLSAPQVSILADHDATLKGVVGHGHCCAWCRCRHQRLYCCFSEGKLHD